VTYLQRFLIMVSALFTALAIMFLLGGLTAFAASPPHTSKIALTLHELRKDNSTGIVSISARLTDAGRPLGTQPVDFFVTTDFFDEWQVNLGTVITDATGTANIAYQPKWEGTHIITARYQSNGEHSPLEATLSLQVSQAVLTYVPEPVGLESVRQWTPIGVGLFVFAIWTLLLFVTFRTMRGIAHARSQVKMKSVRYTQSEKFREIIRKG